MAQNYSKEKIKDIILEHLTELSNVKKQNIKLDNSLIHDLYFDSLDRLDFIIWLENEFSVRLHWRHINRIQTVGQAIEVIVNKLK